MKKPADYKFTPGETIFVVGSTDIYEYKSINPSLFQSSNGENINIYDWNTFEYFITLAEAEVVFYQQSLLNFETSVLRCDQVIKLQEKEKEELFHKMHELNKKYGHLKNIHPEHFL